MSYRMEIALNLPMISTNAIKCNVCSVSANAIVTSALTTVINRSIGVTEFAM